MKQEEASGQSGKIIKINNNTLHHHQCPSMDMLTVRRVERSLHLDFAVFPSPDHESGRVYRTNCDSVTQGRNHFFTVGSTIPWSMVSLPFYRKKLGRSTQFGAVGYIITLYSSKSDVKSWGVRPNFREVWTPRPPSSCVHTSHGHFI